MLRFVHDMRADSPAVRLLLQWEHMILDGTPNADLLDGDGADRLSRLRIIGFTQVWNDDDADGISTVDGNVGYCRTMGEVASLSLGQIIAGSDSVDAAARRVWGYYSVWEGEPDLRNKGMVRRACRKSAFPAMLAFHAMSNEDWAQGMAGVLRRIRAWADGLVSSGTADWDHAKAVMVSSVCHAFNEAFRCKENTDDVSPASLAMSMALGWHVPDSRLTVLREHWADELPAIGFPLVESALRMIMEYRLKIDTLPSVVQTGMRTAMLHRQNTMFAAITCPALADDPWEAFVDAAHAINRLFTAEDDDDATQTWDKITWLPLIPYRIVTGLCDKAPHSIISLISYAHSAEDDYQDERIIDDAHRVDWKAPSADGVMREARRIFTDSRFAGGASTRSLYDDGHMDDRIAGRFFYNAIISAMECGDDARAANMAFLERIISGVCTRLDLSSRPEADPYNCPMLIDGTDLAHAVHGIIDENLPYDFTLQTLAAESTDFTRRMQVKRWERIEEMGIRTRLVSLSHPRHADSGFWTGIRCHVGIYWEREQ